MSWFSSQSTVHKKGDCKYSIYLLEGVFTNIFWKIFDDSVCFLISLFVLFLPDTAWEGSAELCKYSGEK